MRWLSFPLKPGPEKLHERPPSRLETPPSPIVLPGPWRFGVALAIHSEPGSDVPERTEVARLLVRFKYEGERRLAAILGREIAIAVASAAREAHTDLVTHIPTSRRDSFEPACELALATARTLRLRALPRLLRRTRPLGQQKNLTTAAEKTANVEGAFQLRRADLVAGRSVLLVDDVFDSGATLLEAYRVLKQAGAQAIGVATVTRTRFQGGAA